MQKIKLDLSELQVESFAVTSAMGAGKGTVHGESATWTLPIPYGVCTSDNTYTHNAECPTNPDLGTCDHTVCDCDQDGWTHDC